MQSIYESGDKQQLQQKMEENKSFLPNYDVFWRNGYDDVFNDV